MENKKGINFASGWVKTSKTGNEYISIASNPDKSFPKGVKLLAELPDGRTIQLNNFNLYWNQEKKTDKSPDVSLSFYDE